MLVLALVLAVVLVLALIARASARLVLAPIARASASPNHESMTAHLISAVGGADNPAVLDPPQKANPLNLPLAPTKGIFVLDARFSVRCCRTTSLCRRPLQRLQRTST